MGRTKNKKKLLSTSHNKCRHSLKQFEQSTWRFYYFLAYHPTINKEEFKKFRPWFSTIQILCSGGLPYVWSLLLYYFCVEVFHEWAQVLKASNPYLRHKFSWQGYIVLNTSFSQGKTRCTVSYGNVAIRTTSLCIARSRCRCVVTNLQCLYYVLLWICNWHSVSGSQMSRECICPSAISELVSATVY